MSLLVILAGIYVPNFIKKRKLAQLLDATAEAFQTEKPRLEGLAFEECLKEYALFTKVKAEEAIQKGTESDVKFRLYQNAYRLGQGLREEFSVRSMKETMQLSRIVYRIIGIDFQGDTHGEIVIKRCFFSSVYPAEVCGVISSLDAGLLAGLSGGGRLSFSQRLTEGKECCRAHLSFGIRST